MQQRISRRLVIKAVAGTPFCLAAAALAGPDGDRGDAAFRPNAYLTIAADNTISFRVKKCEMGQQIHRAIQAIVADELGADIDQVSLRQAPTLEKFGRVATGGSYAVPAFWQLYRPLIAAAREMLVAAAAQEWRVAGGEIVVRHARLYHEASGREAAFGDFAAAASGLEVPDDPPLRRPSEYRAVGKASGRADAAAILAGEAVFGIDVRLPNLRFAVLEKSPVVAGRLKRYDADAALAVPGVDELVKLDDAVAVIATDSWSAMRGRERLAAEWDFGEHARVDNESLRSRLADGNDGDWMAVRTEGDTVNGDLESNVERDPERDLILTYEMPMAQHAALEPVNATALVEDGRCSVWGPIQMASDAQRQIATRLGLPEAQVTVHTTLAGGSFGRKLELGFAVEAALIASKVTGPVQLLYSREDDMMHGGVRPPTRHEFRFRTSDDGSRIALDYDYAAASAYAQQDRSQLAHKGYDWTAALGAVDLPYAFDDLRIRQRDIDVPAVPFNWWRGTYRNHHAFASECALDEFAEHTDEDPLALRLRLLTRDLTVETFPNELSDVQAERLRGVLVEAAKRSGYDSVRGASRAVGLACHCYSDVHTYVAHAVDVSVDGRQVTINKVVAVVDCGIAVVPDSIVAQMEGSVIFGLTSALWGDVEIHEGQKWPRNFAGCRLMRMSETPDIDVHVIASAASPGGMGEPPLPSVTPAFLNALARAGGPRIRRLPVGDRLKLGANA